ncbi:MAG: hypothetical protein L0229_25695 [Blastocatellia bacterium]|nr:hypothetical protein [Blastocatellia bacterium]
MADFLEGIEHPLVFVAGPFTERDGEGLVESRVERLQSFETDDVALDFIDNSVAGPSASRTSLGKVTWLLLESLLVCITYSFALYRETTGQWGRMSISVFGTPTADGKTGTEHEFNLAYEAWQKKRSPQIFVYFNLKAYNPKSKDEMEQWGQVLEFRNRFPKEGLWWPYKGKPQFEKQVRNHLMNHIRSLSDS